MAWRPEEAVAWTWTRARARLVIRVLAHTIRRAPAATLALALSTVLFAGLVVDQISSFGRPLIVWEGHHWRQSFTYGVAWNFAHASLDVLHPRMFVELASSNVVPMEAPLYPLLASVFLRLGDDSVVGPRRHAWSGLLTTVFVLARFVRDDPRRPSRAGPAETAGLLVALGLAPMVAVDFRSIQPEPLAAGLASLAAFFFTRYRDSHRPRDVVSGGLCFGLSLLSKPLALGVAPGLVLFAVWGSERWRTKAFLTTASLALAIVPWFAWDCWAQHLLHTLLADDWIIEIGHPPREMLRSVLGGGYSAEVLLAQLPHYATSWWLAPAIAAGIYRGLDEPRFRRIAFPMLAWIVGYVVEILAVGVRLHSNAYYLILAAAPLAYFAALGLGALIRLLDASAAAIPTSTFRAALACLVLLPVGWAFSRSSNWSSTIDPGELGFERNRGVWTSALGLARMLLVFLLVFALGRHLKPRRVPMWIGLLLLVAFAALVVRPMRDRAQYFRMYVAADRRDGFDDELRALRAAVDQWSSPSDRVIVSPGGTYREPPMVYLFYLLRNGFPYRDDTPKRAVDDMKRRGARLYVQLDQVEKSSHPYIAGRLLAKGPWWRLSCVAPDDCPPPTPSSP